MACVNPDGTISAVAGKVLLAADQGADERAMAEAAGVPVYRVRASLRELVQAGLLTRADGRWAARREVRHRAGAGAAPAG